jgi:hypothetical protein
LASSAAGGWCRGVSENPYQAPAVEEVVASAVPLSEAEEIRSRHLKHEASLKAIGFLFFLSAVLTALSVVVLLAGHESLAPQTWDGVISPYWKTVGLVLAICIGQFVAGWGLRKLRPWSKFLAGILAVISLIRLFPVVTLSGVIGTLVGVYILYLLFCPKGRTVLSPAYAEIVAQTPHLRYRTPLWIWIALVVIVLLLLAFALFSPAMS